MKPLRNPLNAAAAEIAMDLFDALGEISVKAMFGGAGIYCDGLFFSLIHQGDIYIKTDDIFAAELAKAGSQQFAYTMPKSGKVAKMNYWQLPVAATSDAKKAVVFGKRSIGIAANKK